MDDRNIDENEHGELQLQPILRKLNSKSRFSCKSILEYLYIFSFVIFVYVWSKLYT